MIIPVDNIWKIYYYIGIFSTILFVIKLIIFSLVGGNSEVFGDFNTEFDTDCSFDFLSVQSVMAFFMGFGWMGYAGLTQFGINQIYNLIYALIVGLIFMFVTAFLMFAVKKLEKNVKKDKSTAIEKVGKAYTNLAPKSKGQIEIEINGQLSVVDAINKSDCEIKAFDYVKVVDIIDEILYVEKVEK